MKYTCAVPMCQLDRLIEIARTAEEVGSSSIALPDSIFYMENRDYHGSPATASSLRPA